jgi:hypothetical protein
MFWSGTSNDRALMRSFYWCSYMWTHYYSQLKLGFEFCNRHSGCIFKVIAWINPSLYIEGDCQYSLKEEVKIYPLTKIKKKVTKKLIFYRVHSFFKFLD